MNDTCELLAIGGSLGGFDAVRRILSDLPIDFAIPLVVALHRARDTSQTLADLLDRACPLPVVEAEDKEPIRSGRVFLAPADYHLLVEPGRLCLSLDAPVRHARPSIDVLFETSAEAYGPSVCGVLLTGSNRDGALGLVRIRAAGGLAVVQDPATAQRSEMPRAAMETGAADRILPLTEIGSFLAGLPVRSARAGARR